MRFRRPYLLAALLTAGAAALPGSAAAADQELARQGYAFLKQYCHRCHGVDFKVPRYNVLDRDILLEPGRNGQKPYLTPGKPDQSAIWQRVAVDEDMPPSGRQPSAADRKTLKRWIEAGAPFPRPQRPRPFQSEKDLLAIIRDHLRRDVRPGDRRFQRYFTLTHLHNHTGVRAADLRLHRAALAKLVNSLSWQADIVVPRVIDRPGTVLNVDLRDLGWDRHPDPWREILGAYPYGLSHRNSRDRGKRDLAREVSDLADCSLPYVRADWFIARASRPPLYHALLELPRDARQLERKLGVNVRANFLGDQLARAGLTSSGVSRHNRLVERHPASGGAAYYWKSYDFKSSEGRGNLLSFPLGPAFARQPFPDQAFRHAGGEILFSLPNGLQGYLLVDANDNRIEAGPIDIVRDSQETAGSAVIVTGLSCMACHKHGLIEGFQDVVRTGTTLAGKFRAKVERLYPGSAEMDRLVKKDQAHFLRALEQAAGPFLRVDADRNKSIRDFPEPIGAVARRYYKDLDLEEAARELGFPDPRDLRRCIQTNEELRRLGLGPLAAGARVKRELWESLHTPLSLFHKAAAELELGTPLRLRE